MEILKNNQLDLFRKSLEITKNFSDFLEESVGGDYLKVNELYPNREEDIAFPIRNFQYKFIDTLDFLEEVGNIDSPDTSKVEQKVMRQRFWQVRMEPFLKHRQSHPYQP